MKKNVHSGRQDCPAAKALLAPARSSAAGLYTACGHRKYLNGDERRRFIAAAMDAAPTIRTFCLTLTHIGCRISEALSLTGEDIDVASGLISVRCLKKRGKLVIRQIPTPPVLLNDILRVHALRDMASEQLRTALWSWGRTRAWQHVKLIMAAAAIHHAAGTPKGLRHAFGVHAVLSGVPLTLIQKWLGHADMKTTAIYTDLLGPEEQEVARRMW